MTKKYFPITFLMLVFLCISLQGFSQNTIGLIQQGNGLEQSGYILFAPIAYNKTYLIDKCGLLVHSWDSNYKPGLSAYLLPDGNLLRSGNTQNSSFNYGGSGGIIEKIDWNGNVIWSYLISTDSLLQHHDIYPMPNGNVLALVWQKKTVIQVLQEGRDSLTITDHFLNEKIIEIQPVGLDSAVIVWEWNLWDHFIQDYDSTKENYGSVIDHPELFNINHQIDVVNNPDWLHLNSVFYSPALNQIIVSSRTNNEFYILDHSTSTLKRHLMQEELEEKEEIYCTDGGILKYTIEVVLLIANYLVNIL
ncbi:MAG: aryl-sulfate sulfotransferase [Bacteroidetes bacterium]|nr:aryl-sulfate sulfotransferase [Bacteroidota bacterium]